MVAASPHPFKIVLDPLETELGRLIERNLGKRDGRLTKRIVIADSAETELVAALKWLVEQSAHCCVARNERYL